MSRESIGNFLLMLLVAGLGGCGYRDGYPSSPADPGTREGQRYDRFPSPSQPERPDLASGQRRWPWETWSLGQDLYGRPLSDVNLLAGDELIRQGQPEAALKRYESAAQSALNPVERETAVLRVASVLLGQDRAREALAVLGRHFTSRQAGIEQVDARFSLLFAYAYGRAGDMEQSLAWFSRANRLAGGRGDGSAAAAAGVDLLLRSLPEDQFLALMSVWSSDSFINTQIGQEHLRRQNLARGYQDPVAGGAFWERDHGQLGALTPGPESAGEVPVLLPLSGQFGALGQSTKNGIELAFEAEASGVRPRFEDTGGDAVQAAALMERVAGWDRNSLVIGPLLAAPAMAAASVAAQRGIGMLTLSKRSSFPTGGGVFRLGYTTASQMRTLVETAQLVLQRSRFAMLYPADEVGREFAEEFREQLRREGLSLVFERSYLPTDAGDFTQLAQQVEGSNADAVFLPDNLQAAIRFAMSLSEGGRRNLTMLGTTQWYQPQEIARSQQILEGVVFVTPFFTDSNRDYVRRFVGAYQARHRQRPDFLAAQGFDAATLVLAGLRRQREQGGNLVTALQSIDTYEGLTGIIKVDASGELDRRFLVLQVKPEGLVELPPAERPIYIMRGSGGYDY